MIKILLSILFVLLAIICWLFATSTTVSGKHNRQAFAIKSFFYWMIVLASIGFGYLIATL
jgi:hypothetical protein